MELSRIRITLVMGVAKALGGQMPGRLLRLAQDVQPIDDRYVGFACNEELVRTWVAAVTALRENADAPLPGAGGG